MVFVINERTPTFSRSSAWLGVSNRTLAGWKAIGLIRRSVEAFDTAGAVDTHPIIRSYCCCRMLGDTWQSTWPELKVIASASAISDWIDAGMAEFLFAGPTHISVAPRCSNSLAPSCAISAPDTNDSTTLVGNLCSRYDSTPSACVVLTRMQVC